MRACGSRSLSIVAATVLLSVGQFSPAKAATITVLPDQVDFFEVNIGTTKTIQVTATLTPDEDARSFVWIIPAPSIGIFSATKASFPASTCGFFSTTCIADVSYAPKMLGDDLFLQLQFFVAEVLGDGGFTYLDTEVTVTGDAGLGSAPSSTRSQPHSHSSPPALVHSVYSARAGGGRRAQVC